jgi:catalase (peroxidase I)
MSISVFVVVALVVLGGVFAVGFLLGHNNDSGSGDVPAPGPSPIPNVPASACKGLYDGTPPSDQSNKCVSPDEYAEALKALDLEAVKKDIQDAMTNSQDCWPADFGNYGPFFVRLAWHCSGSYRKSDGKGGCSGGRQRFEPERSWPDNTNLDKARALLAPIKEKYGAGLSWGDLFTLGGTTALRSMGTPIKQFCAGRIDSCDGLESLDLGPGYQQEQKYPCKRQGKCKNASGLGSTTVGLIYLNPEGPVALNESTGQWSPNPDPLLSAADVRDSFSRMDHDDRGTVALIGGGHAVGKTHGACPSGAGKSPKEAYASQKDDEIPWPGLCGTGKGKDSFTAGFEGPWTTNPLKWDIEYFEKLVNKDGTLVEWEKHIGPGGHWQWRLKNPKENERGLMRLTSDMALTQDSKYLAIVKEFRNNITAFDEAFDIAWTKLITKGGSWSKSKFCDSGSFPEHLLLSNGMLPTDLMV